MAHLTRPTASAPVRQKLGHASGDPARISAVFLERENELGLLHSLVDDLDSSGGRVVLVRGEAGIGKSTLVGRFTADVADQAHVLEGACDDLITPQPFGPIWDVAREEPSIAALLASDDRRGVMDGLLDLMARKLRPTIMVLEDTQWADEATLDVIRFLGRRIARTHGLLLLTYRVGEVDADHPLRRVIGELPPRHLVRIHLAPLSADGVARLIEHADLDLDDVLALTGGNPLFVSEIATSGVERVPSSVQDSVLARAARLSSGARQVLDLASITPGETERALIEDVLGPADDDLRECERRGLLRVHGDTVSFPHELTRRAIEASLGHPDRRRLNEQALSALAGHEDPARLAHYARQAGDVDAVVKLAPAAARAALAMASHREALSHFRALEPLLGRVDPGERAAILEDWARAAYLEGEPDAPDLMVRALAARRLVGDRSALGRSLAFAVRVFEVNGRPDEATACAEEAVTILGADTRTPDLAYAVSQQAWLGLMRGRETEGSRIAARALALADQVGDDLTKIRALIVKGACDYSLGDEGGVALVEEAHRLAERSGHHFEEAFALVNLAGMAGDVRDLRRAIDLGRRARNTAARYEIRPLESYARAQHAELLMWRGDWSEAEDEATEVLGADPHAEVVAWRLLGTIQARRGRDTAREPLDRMWAMAEAAGELQHVDPAAGTIAESMWLSGVEEPDRVASIRRVYDHGLDLGAPWPSGALAFWWWKLGHIQQVPDRTPAFYRRIVEGRWQEAADFWESRDAPYEQALALMHGDDDAAVRALRIFEDLGADAAAARLRRTTLLDRGLKLPRGRARSTRRHAAGLTPRQAEVLDLLAEGLTNVEIADRLFVSHRTVENHVAAVLMKLDAANRSAAVETARELGLLE